MDEIPANPIDSSNSVSNFSPIKFVEKFEKDPLSQLENEPSEELKNSIQSNNFNGKEQEVHVEENGAEFSRIVDDEITISALTARIQDDKFIGTRIDDDDDDDKNDDKNCDNDNGVDHYERLQRKSDEDLCNTPKRERHQDRAVHERSQKYEYESVSGSPTKRNEVVKSLSMEFERRMASLQGSPKPSVDQQPIAAVLNAPSSASNSRVMSPIRCVPQLSSANKLNLNDDVAAVDGPVIETPKLVSPSKIAAVGTPSLVVDSEKIIKSELESRWSKQVEFLQFEVSTLQEKYEESIKNNAEMRTMLAEYEKTLAQFIDARRTRPDQHSSIDQLIQDKKKLEVELQSLQISYQNLHQRYEDMKGLQEQSRISDATLRQSIQLLQQELASTVRTLENTRRAYEDKLEKMSNESKNVKEGLEYELSATKAKLLKSELKISSLESAIETKTRENSELMTICDELIHKMDKRIEK